MGKKLHHCSNCLRLSVCKKAFWPGSENCDLYVRDCCDQCHKCLKFGQECQRSGFIRCNFQPRLKEESMKKMSDQKKAEINQRNSR